MPDAVSADKGPGENAVLNGFLELADDWVSRKADDRGIAWFRRAIDDVAHAGSDRALGVAIGLAPRRLGKADLSLTAADLAQAEALRPGLDLSDWSIDQLARMALMAASHRGDKSAFAARFDSFCRTAEINELIALYRGLPLYPNAASLEPRAREAVRSGMKPVFEAVAHRNPYPARDFRGGRVESDGGESPVHGLNALADSRAGSARQSGPCAHACRIWRRSAGRRGGPISGEMWRCVAPHADSEGVAALVHAWNTGSDRERLAIALALETAPACSCRSADEGSCGSSGENCL